MPLISFVVGVGSFIGSTVAISANVSANAVATQVAPICSIDNFVIHGDQSDGGAGTYQTYVYLTNSGPSCRLVPIGARAYDDTTRAFVGTTATISKPDVTKGSLFPYDTTHLLGTINYGQSVALLLSYADVGMGLNGCGRVATADAMAFWMTNRPRVVKVTHLVYGLRGAFTTLQTCSKLKYLGVSWPSTGSFWFAS